MTAVPEVLYCLDCHTAYLNRPDVQCTGNCDGDGPVGNEDSVQRSRENKWGPYPAIKTGRFWCGGRKGQP